MTSPDKEQRPHLIGDTSMQTGLDEIAFVEKLEAEGISARSLIGWRSHIPEGRFLRKIHKRIHQKKRGTKPR